jgi:hypothetical protein
MFTSTITKAELLTALLSFLRSYSNEGSSLLAGLS